MRTEAGARVRVRRPNSSVFPAPLVLTAVIVGVAADEGMELVIEVGDVVEPAGIGDLSDALAGFDQKPAGVPQAYLANEVG